jgi:hypothetical protein
MPPREVRDVVRVIEGGGRHSNRLAIKALGGQSARSWMSAWKPSVRGGERDVAKIEFGTGWAAGEYHADLRAHRDRIHAGRAQIEAAVAHVAVHATHLHEVVHPVQAPDERALAGPDGPLRATTAPRRTRKATSRTAVAKAVADGDRRRKPRVLARFGHHSAGRATHEWPGPQRERTRIASPTRRSPVSSDGRVTTSPRTVIVVEPPQSRLPASRAPSSFATIAQRRTGLVRLP